LFHSTEHCTRSKLLVPNQCAYQSECGDQRAHDRHWVSKVFHSCPQVQDQRSSLRGEQPQSGHRMRGPDGPRPSSWSGSRSKTTDDLVRSSERAHMSQYYVPIWFAGSPRGKADGFSTKTANRVSLTTSTRIVPEF